MHGFFEISGNSRFTLKKEITILQNVDISKIIKINCVDCQGQLMHKK